MYKKITQILETTVSKRDKKFLDKNNMEDLSMVKKGGLSIDNLFKNYRRSIMAFESFKDPLYINEENKTINSNIPTYIK